MPMFMLMRNFLKIKLPLVAGLISIFLFLGLIGEAFSSDLRESRYRAFAIEGSTDLVRLREQLSPEEMTLVLKINRRDDRHLKYGMELMIPESFEDLDRYSPFPRCLPPASEIPKLIFVSRRVQAFAAYENGSLARWGPTSTGRKEQPTPATLYHSNWKSRLRRSSVNPSWLMPWYVNIHTSMGVGLHQYAMPGYPNSHGCIRLLKDDAYWVFHWTDSWQSSDGRTAVSYGTPVIIFGDYDYNQTPPWTRLVEDPLAGSVTSAEVDSTLDRYLWILRERNRYPEVLPDSAALLSSSGE